MPETVADRVEELKGSLVHRREGETISIAPWGPDGLRVRATAGPTILETTWALTEPVDRSNSKITISQSEAVIRNGRYPRGSAISAPKADTCSSSAIPREGERTCILSEHDYVVGAHNPGTRVFQPRGDRLHYAETSFAARDGERLYGMGLNVTGRVNLKGCVIDLYQRHVKHVVPFLVSSEGYGFLWNNPSLGRAEFANNRTRWISAGADRSTITSRPVILTRKSWSTMSMLPAMPRSYPTGHRDSGNASSATEPRMSSCRWRGSSNARVFPCRCSSSIFKHWKYTGDWKLDPEFWPDPEAMVRELREMGVRIMISPWIVVGKESENYAPMKDRGLFTSSIDGARDTVNFGGMPGEDSRMYLCDPTNPEAAAYLWSKWKENYFDIGIRIFWLDPCDDFHLIHDYDQVLYHIGPAIEAHCYFPVAHQRNICEGLHSAGEEEVVTICRSSWAGSQRYGASPGGARHRIVLQTPSRVHDGGAEPGDGRNSLGGRRDRRIHHARQFQRPVP